MQKRALFKKFIALGLTAALGAGSILPVTAAEMTVEEKAGGSMAMLAHYPLQEDAEDISGNENNGQIHGSVTWEDGLVLPGGRKTSDSSASYVTLPEGMLDKKDEVTISAWIKSNTNSGNYSALFFGTPAQGNQMPLNYWLFNPTNPNGLFKSVFTNGNNVDAPYQTEAGVTSAATTAFKGGMDPLHHGADRGLCDRIYQWGKDRDSGENENHIGFRNRAAGLYRALQLSE